MPLSDREQQILQEIERNLLADDPSQVGSNPQRKMGIGRAKGGVLVFVLGLAALIGFFFTGALVVGIVAFGAMVGGLVLIAGGVRDAAIRNFRDLSSGDPSGAFGRWEQRLRDRYKRS